MNWRFYFTNTIADRGYQYYRRGLVQNVEKEDEKYTAEVVGTSPYSVSVWKKANNQLGMTCSCSYAGEGKKCKHMAALCAYLDSNLKDEKVFGTQATPKESWKVDTEVHPFPLKNVPGERDYTYFDLGVITRGVTMMSSQLEAAKKLIEQGNIELKNVNVGTGMYYYGEGTQTGKAVAFCKDKRGLVVVSILFSAEQILEANCGVSGCNHSYSYYARYYRTKICPHQIATLLLLEDYIEKNRCEQRLWAIMASRILAAESRSMAAVWMNCIILCWKERKKSLSSISCLGKRTVCCGQAKGPLSWSLR